MANKLPLRKTFEKKYTTKENDRFLSDRYSLENFFGGIGLRLRTVESRDKDIPMNTRTILYHIGGVTTLLSHSEMYLTDIWAKIKLDLTGDSEKVNGLVAKLKDFAQSKRVFEICLVEV